MSDEELAKDLGQLSTAIAKLLRAEHGSGTTLLNVADEETAGRAFLDEWAADQGLSDAPLRVETGDGENAIGRAATAATMVVLGASERSLLSRLVGGSVVMDVVEDAGRSVLLAEKRGDRSLLTRFRTWLSR